MLSVSKHGAVVRHSLSPESMGFVVSVAVSATLSAVVSLSNYLSKGLSNRSAERSEAPVGGPFQRKGGWAGRKDRS